MHQLRVTITSELPEPNRERISNLLRTVARRVNGFATDINGGDLAAPDLSGRWDLAPTSFPSEPGDDEGTVRLPLIAPNGKPEMSIPVARDLIDRCDAAVTSAAVEAIVRAAMVAMGDDYDSLDREALFTRLCSRFALDYELLYQEWLSGRWASGG
jgi:hypothetical protein